MNKHISLDTLTTPDPDQIINAVCIACSVSLINLKGIKQTRNLSEARSICAGLIFNYHPSFTLKKFGSMFNRHHSTVIYSKKTFNDLMDTNKDFQRKVATAKEFL